MTKDLLEDRGSVYGTFVTQAEIGQELKYVIHQSVKEKKTLFSRSDQEEALEMIATKIARIINGNPDYVDSWRDIAGYATLVADRLDGTVQ